MQPSLQLSIYMFKYWFENKILQSEIAGVDIVPHLLPPQLYIPIGMQKVKQKYKILCYTT